MTSLDDKIAIAGGTGKLGRGLALRLVKDHDVIIGSRSLSKAEEACKVIAEKAAKLYGGEKVKGSLTGMVNEDAIKNSSFIILAIKAEELESFLEVSSEYEWKNKLLLSPVTRMAKDGSVYSYQPFRYRDQELSAAEYIQLNIKDAKVVSAFHLIPAFILWNSSKLNYDVPVAGEKYAADRAIKMLSSIEGLRFLYAGPLQVSRLIESALPLLLNIGIRNGFNYPGMRIVA